MKDLLLYHMMRVYCTCTQKLTSTTLMQDIIWILKPNFKSSNRRHLTKMEVFYDACFSNDGIPFAVTVKGI